MSVENKIKELLGRSGDKQLTEESAQNLNAKMGDAGVNAAANAKKDSSKAAQASTAGDTTQPKQGSSKDASIEKFDETEPGKASAGVSKDTTLPKSKGDAKSVKTQASEEEIKDGETITEEDQEGADIQSQLNSIFGEDLSEEFKTKATSIFEAAVIARVNSEMEAVTTKLEEQNAAQLVEFKEGLVEKVDSYLNYVVEQWMEENKIAIDTGLRTEIAEDFISGLKTLFKEHYIEVPEEKYDVLDEMQKTAEALESKLNETIEQNVAISKELADVKRAQVFEEQTKDLAATEAEKLKKLVEGVDFESEDLYREKVSVIKENYFPKAAKPSPEKVLVEESGTNPAAFEDNTMSKYVQAISRTLKTR